MGCFASKPGIPAQPNTSPQVTQPTMSGDIPQSEKTRGTRKFDDIAGGEGGEGADGPATGGKGGEGGGLDAELKAENDYTFGKVQGGKGGKGGLGEMTGGDGGKGGGVKISDR